MSPSAVTIVGRRLVAAAVLGMAACSSAREPRAPTALTKEQVEVCKRVERAYREQDPEYPRLRDAALADPAVADWLVRVFVIDVSVVRERQGVRDDDFMRAAARTDDETIAVRAAAEIATIGAKAVPVLVDELLLHEQPQPRAVGIELLTKVGMPAVPELKRVLRDGKPQQRRAAARALGAIGLDAEAFAMLRDLAKSGDWTIRADAMLGLAGGGEPALAILVDHVRNDADKHVRRMAARSLAKFKTASAAHALVDYLERCKGEPNRSGEEEAQYALQAMSGTLRARTVAAWRAYANELDAGAAGRRSQSK